ncbi:MAG: hypothetical protein IKH54_01685 [Bacilli bacterium]|nr:hypothetical protein [Bacilli bacterium]
MDKDVYNNLLKNSISGPKTSSKKTKTITINKEKFKRKLVTLCLACTIFGAIAANSINALAKGVSDGYDVYKMCNEFKTEVVSPNTFRVGDHKQYYDYRHEEIAEKVKTDVDVYMLYNSIETKDFNKVMNNVDGSNSLDEYAKKHNFEDANDFCKQTRDKMILEKDVKEKQAEINKMQEEHESNKNVEMAENNQELGGK